MPCTPNCGSCCDPVQLSEDQVDRIFAFGPSTPQGSQLRDLLEPLGPSDSNGSVLLRCVEYDVETRVCQAYDTRPPMCRQFPFYGRPPEESGKVNNVCGYVVEQGRTVLPIVEVT